MKEFVYYPRGFFVFLIKVLWMFFLTFGLGRQLVLLLWLGVGWFFSVFYSGFEKIFAYIVVIMAYLLPLIYFFWFELGRLKKMREVKMVSIDWDFLVFSLTDSVIHSYKRGQFEPEFHQFLGRRTLIIKELNSVISHNSVVQYNAYDLSLFRSRDLVCLQDLLRTSENAWVQKVETMEV